MANQDFNYYDVRTEIAADNDPVTLRLSLCSNDNNLARLHNSQISRPDQPLMHLRSVFIDEPIPYFPETVNDLQRLSSQYISNTM